MRSVFINASGVIGGGVVVASILNYLFTIIMGRLLSPSDFAEVVMYMGLLLIVGIPGLGLSLKVSKQVAYLHYYQHKILLLSVIIIVTSPLTLTFIASFLKTSYTSLALFLVLVPCALLFTLYVGALQGKQDFRRYSIMQIMASTLKLVLALLLVLIGLKVAGVIVALILGTTLTLLYARRALGVAYSRAKLTKTEVPPDRLIDFHIITMIFWGVLIYGDVVLANHFLLASDAPFYAAASSITKIIFYLTYAFSTTLFPIVSSSEQSVGEHRSVLKLAMLLTLATGVVGIVVCYALPDIVISIAFGRQYLASATILGPLAIAMTMLSLLTVMTHYLLAQGLRKVSWVLLSSVVLLITCLSLIAPSPIIIAWTLSGVALWALVLQAPIYIKS